MKTKKPKSSGKRMREAGFRPVQVWLTQEQYDRLFTAAAIEGRPATQFLVFHGDTAAEKIIEKKRKKSVVSY